MDSGILQNRPGEAGDRQAPRPAAMQALGPAVPEARSWGSFLRPVVAFSTTGLPAAAQFRTWRGQCSSVIDMVEPLGSAPGFPASCTSWRFGPFALIAVLAPAVRYRRTCRQTRRDTLDHWGISVTRRGTHSMRTGAGTSTAPTGLPYIFSFADAFEGQCTDIDMLCLCVPRETFPELAPLIDRCRQFPLESGMGQLLACYLKSLDARLPGMTDAELPRLVSATRAMVASCVAPAAETREVAAVQLSSARRERVRQAIRQNLRSPRLTPKRLCTLTGMSRSQLYRLLEPSGGVARYIQAERMREAYRALSDPEGRRHIHEIAEDLGCFDASTFCRAFRREFGCAPSDVRMAALAGKWSGPVRRSPAVPGRSAAPLDFAAMLHQL